MEPNYLEGMEISSEVEFTRPNSIPEGQECPTCMRRVPRAKKSSSPKTKVVSLRVPVSDAETFEEILVQAAKNADLYEKGHWRYFTVLRGLVHVLQEVSSRD